MSVLFTSRKNKSTECCEYVVCLCMYVFMYVCMYVYVFMCMYLCMYVYVFMYVRTYVRMYVCMYVCMYVVTVQSRAKFLSNQYHKRVGKLFVILGIDLARTIAEMVHVVNNV